MVGLALLAVLSSGRFAAAAEEGGSELRFARDVQPILSEFCFQCHGPDAKAREGNLRLDRAEDALRRDDPVIVPGNAAGSALIERVVSQDDERRMPPPSSKRRPTPAQIETLRRWIDQGARWGGHWAFEPIGVSGTPVVNDSRLARHPLDHYLIARLEQHGSRMADPASGSAWLRRVALDLTGLPPEYELLVDFQQPELPDAGERAADRLLASPAYGERMVWEWLDAARYADSNGYQGDAERTMWPWRDWAIGAFNRDLPFDQFSIWQLAGDLLPESTHEQKLATGFCRNHMINGEGGRIAAENRVDYVMDMTETAGTVWLGLTLNCCRCHDHKFDPLSQREYYQLAAFFNNQPVDGGGGDPQTRPVLEAASPEQLRQRDELDGRLTAARQALDKFEQQRFPREDGQTAADSAAAAELPAEIREILKNAGSQRNRGQLEKLEKQFAADNTHTALLQAIRSAGEARDAVSRSIPRVMIMEELPDPRENFILYKGLYDKPAEKVGIRVPEQLARYDAEWPSNRLGLARWLFAAEQPLTARVIVNRFWSQLFGAGIVKTTEDFGVQGDRPEHPELLDRLAHDFRTDWDVKRLMRALVLSGAYRQSSRATPELLERDPENRMLARGPRGRMPSWMLRDQALAVSGLLTRRMGGPPVRPYQPNGIWEEATFGNKRYEQDHGESLYRRSAYTFWRRIIAPSVFFDSGSRQTCTVKQARTNTPLHALLTLNDTTYVEAARALAWSTSDLHDPRERLRQLFLRTLIRDPRPEEIDILLAARDRLARQFSAEPASADALLAVGEFKNGPVADPIGATSWIALCNTILNLDEVLCKE
ncbi:MAG: DUF1553 domain-containing protein [Planctomycetes bacterium]|nr:DUF1553 domain-containing protein [Planctomycetota bacterium]